MDKITLGNNIQSNSLQIGDDAYYVALTDGYGNSDPKPLGKIKTIKKDVQT